MFNIPTSHTSGLKTQDICGNNNYLLYRAILGEFDYMDMTTTRCVGLMWTLYLIEHMCLSGSHMTRLVMENGHRKHVSR